MNLLEQSVWEKVKKGDKKSFRILFDTFYKGLYNYAYDFLKNREESEELVLDFFIVLWTERDSITINTSIRSYLYRSVHNRCINFIKQSAGYRKKTAEYSDDLTGDESSALFAKEEFALEVLIAKELERDIEIAVNELPDQCRKIFCMSRFEQMKIKDIAACLEVSESTVKTQLSRALEKIRGSLGKYLS